MTKLYISLIFFIFIFIDASPQNKVNIIYSNKNNVCKNCEKLLNPFVKPKQDSLIVLFENCYKNNGYLSISIDSVVSDSTSTNVYCYNNLQYKWSYLKYYNNKQNKLNFPVKKNKNYSNKVINPEKLFKTKTKIINFYENSGYPFASITADSVEVSKGIISSNYQINSGNLFYFDSLEIVGNVKVSQKFISKSIDIVNNKVYCEKRLSQIKQRINELPFLSIDKPTETYFINDKAKVRLFLKNKKANQFNGIIGILPKNDEPGKFNITGDISLNLLNSFRHGDQINFSWKKLEPLTQNLDASINFPYIFNKPIGIFALVKFFKKDTTYFNFKNHIALPFFLTGTNNVAVYYENATSTVFSNSTYSTLTVLPANAGFKSNMYGLSIYLSELDYKFNPHKGVLINLKAGYGKKTIEKISEVNQSLYNNISLKTFKNEVNVDVSEYLLIINDLVLKFRQQAGNINSKTLFKNEEYRIGGLSTLRGFDEESIYATGYFIGSTELRYLFEKNSAFFLFYDQAYYKSIEIKSDNPFGFGLGIEFQTKAGIFTLSYALGKQNGNDIQLKSAKIHFGFVNRF